MCSDSSIINMREKPKHLLLVVFHLTCMVISVIGFCDGPQDMYVRRGTFHHCRKIYNCRPDHEILPCINNCEKERCVQCENGTVQPELIHSDTKESHRRCFTPGLEKCEGMTVPTQDGQDLRTCPEAKSCKCNLKKCFYGNYPCGCSRQFNDCGINQTLTNDGKCVPCPGGTYKPYKGCEDCYRIDPYVNKEQGTMSTPKPAPTPSTTSKPVIKPDPNPSPKPDPGPMSRTENSTTTISTTTSAPMWTKPPTVMAQPTTDGNHQSSGIPLHTIIIIIAVFFVVIVGIIVLFVFLCKTNRLQGLKRRLRRGRRGRNAPNLHVRFNEEGDNLIRANGQCPPNGVVTNRPGRREEGRDRNEQTRPMQEETPESPAPGVTPRSASEDCYPLLPGYSPGVNIEEPSLYQVRLQMEETKGGQGKSSLESHSSGGSIPTPVPETGPSPEAHPLENIREYYRSISREIPPNLLGPEEELDEEGAHAMYADIHVNKPNPPSSKHSPVSYETVNRDFNVSSTTSVIPPSSSTATSYPSPIVSDSMQTVGTEDYRVSALNCRDTSFDVQKVPEQSLRTASLSSDCADNTPDLCSLQPQQHEDESMSPSVSRLSTCQEEEEEDEKCDADRDSISVLKKEKKDSKLQDR